MGRLNKTIRVAGNTMIPCYCAVKQKGYNLDVYYTNINNEYFKTLTAKKADLVITADDVYELLALIAVWEYRGKNWEASKEELNKYKNMIDKVPIYDINDNKIVCNNASLKKIKPIDVACYLVLKLKGYKFNISCDFYKEVYNEFEEYKCYDDYMWCFDVKKKWTFSGTTIQEALALLIMWEVRGGESYTWKSKHDEIDIYEDMINKAPIYDIDGNKIEDK